MECVTGVDCRVTGGWVVCRGWSGVPTGSECEAACIALLQCDWTVLVGQQQRLQLRHLITQLSHLMLQQQHMSVILVIGTLLELH